MIEIQVNEDKHKKRTKYNVGSDLSKRTFDGIVFDSCMEMKYYRDVVLPLSRSGEILEYELQKPFVLQPKFHNGKKTVQPIVYVADFYIKYRDGKSEVIDTKGCADSAAKMKRKMFWFHYPDVDYRWITYSKIDGGWVDYDDLKKARKERKKLKQAQTKGR